MDIKTIIQAIIALPIVILITYLSIWVSFIITPALIGIGLFALIYWLFLDYKEYKKEEEENTNDRTNTNR